MRVRTRELGERRKRFVALAYARVVVFFFSSWARRCKLAENGGGSSGQLALNFRTNGAMQQTRTLLRRRRRCCCLEDGGGSSWTEESYQTNPDPAFHRALAE